MTAARRLAISADLIALGDAPAQVIGGTIVYEAEHGDAQASLVTFFGERFHRRSGGDDPGGWWLFTEVDIELAPHEFTVRTFPAAASAPAPSLHQPALQAILRERALDREVVGVSGANACRAFIIDRGSVDESR